nr:hypothetical protein Iba_chr09bCG9030 [Ipomoea batatas]GMD35636.1 hypothetical protein Iba_chr09dCG8810 [Ipomoea batatas]GMD37438.1 hypothetical protein Iba_chr09eCG9320 [Ipomoea batatas]
MMRHQLFFGLTMLQLDGIALLNYVAPFSLSILLPLIFGASVAYLLRCLLENRYFQERMLCIN